MQAQIHRFRTKAGNHIYVRRLRPDDAPLLVDIFEHMGSESRYRRFHQPLENVNAKRVWEEAQRIAHADPAKNLSLVAFAEVKGQTDTPVGAARYVALNAHEAEAAISVRDDWQRQGIGTQLMRLLSDQARASGLKRLVATIQNDNVGVWRVFERLPYVVTRTPEGSDIAIAIELSQRKDPRAMFARLLPPSMR